MEINEIDKQTNIEITQLLDCWISFLVKKRVTMCIKQNGSFYAKYPGIGHYFKKTQIISCVNDSYDSMSGKDHAAMTKKYLEQMYKHNVS